MLVNIPRHWACHLRTVALLAIFPAACSLVVGELPEPLSNVGPMAGGVGGDSGSRGLGGEDAAGGSEEPVSAGGASGGDGSFVAGGVRNSGQGGDISDSGGAAPAGSGGAGSTDACDADGDMHRAPGICSGDDCDDSDPQASPDQTGYFASRQPHVDFDYNCDGVPEQEQMAAVVCSGLSLGACPTEVSGFLDTLPACGEVGAWGKCVKTPPLNTCDKMIVDAERRMRCR
jgi:hypothetical protein